MPKVLFVHKNRIDSYGISFGLVNSASFTANALVCHGISSKVVCVVDNNGIDKEVHDYKPTHVVIEAIWVVPDKIKLLINKYPKVKWVVIVHSKAPFLSNEGIAIDWLYKYEQLSVDHCNFEVASNNTQLRNNMDGLGLCLRYLPNIYYPPYDVEPDYMCKKEEVIDIGCFGAIRPLKNQLVQAMAAIEFANRLGKQLRFHINGSRIEQNGNPILKNLRSLFDNSEHMLVEHGWYSHKDFLKVVSDMDMGMQVSMSESFNIVSADFVKQNIPIVVSSEIEWMPFWTKSAMDMGSIVDKMRLLWRFRNLGLHRLNKKYLCDYNQEAIYYWFDFVY